MTLCLANRINYMKKILIVSYTFPPSNVSGAFRIGKFAKYLPEFGWETWILTLEQGLESGAGEPDSDLLECDINRIIRANLGIFTARIRRKNIRTINKKQLGNSSRKIYINKIRKWLSGFVTFNRFPDRALPWYLPAIRAGLKVMNNKKFDVILSSFGPPGSHVVASILSRKTGVPWVADYRDLWTQNHLGKRGWLISKFETIVELIVIKPSCELITVSPFLQKQLYKLHEKPTSIIPNGFDPNDFIDRKPLSSKDGILRFCYTGMIYPDKRDGTMLFEAIQKLVNSNRLTNDRVEVDFIGTPMNVIQPWIKKSGATFKITGSDRMPHSVAVKCQQDSDICVILEWNDPSALGVSTGKIFDYLGSCRPILAFGPRGGSIDNILNETQAGILVTSANEAFDVLASWLDSSSTERLVPTNSNPEIVLGYTRRSQAEALSKILNRVVG